VKELNEKLEEITKLSEKQNEEINKLNELVENYKKENENRIKQEKEKTEMEVRIKDEVYTKHKRNIYGMVYSNVIYINNYLLLTY